MITKSIHLLTLPDLNALLGNVREGKTIEFKREMPAKTPDEKINFLAAVSSLANTAGGDLLVGIDAVDGLATSIPGVAFANVDGEILRLEQLLASLIEPRLPRVDMETIACSDGRHVLVIRVPRSWIGPHRVLSNDKFYGRNSAGKYPLDTGELRTAFVLSETAVERIRNFRNDRLMKIAAGETPLVMQSGSAMVIHVVPFSTFAAGRTLDIVDEIARCNVMPLPPGRFGHPNEHRANIDGLVTFTSRSDQPVGGYAQVFRSGAVEGVDALDVDNDGPYLVGNTFKNTVVYAIKNYLTLLKSLDLGYPVFVFLSFCGRNGCLLRSKTEIGSGYYPIGPLRQDIIALPEISIESETVEVGTAMRPIFNNVWNAFGFHGSGKYDQQGKWIGRA